MHDIVIGVSSPPAITNLRGRIEAATRTPLTATGSAPGSTVLIARITDRSASKGFSPALLVATATSLGTAFPPKLFRRDLLPRGSVLCLDHRLSLSSARPRMTGCTPRFPRRAPPRQIVTPPPPCARPTRRAPSPP